MKTLIITFLLIAAIIGAGGYFGWQAYNQSLAPAPAMTAPPPPPPPKVTEAERKAAQRYRELTKQLESDKGNADLYAKRGRAMMDGRMAVSEDLGKLSVAAIEDLAKADQLGSSSPDLYGDLVLAAKWIDVIHPLVQDEDAGSKEPPERKEWFEKTRTILDAACRRSPDAHRARVDFIEFRLNKMPQPSDPNVWRGKQLESLDTLIKLDGKAEDAELAGDVAKMIGKKPLAKAYYLQAIELQPGSKARIEAKMKGL